MRLETKAQIAKATLILLVIVAVLFFLGGFVIVLCAGLQVNPFRETTTSFLVSAFIGLIGAATILVLLNVATNISLIADAKIAELKVEPRPGVLKKWIMVSVAAGILLAGFIFAGTYISKERYLKVVRSQSEEVLKANNGLVEEISRLLASGKPEDYTRINEIRFFLQSQRAGLPQLTVIYGGNFSGKVALYAIHSYFYYDRNTKYTPTYFTCTQNLDCDYLTQFFSGNNQQVLQHYTLRDDQFYIYVPVVEKESRFVLQFSRVNNYGKIGS